MKHGKAYLIGTHPDSFRPGEPAEIIGVGIAAPAAGLPPRPYYRVKYFDEQEDCVAVYDSTNFRIISADDILAELEPLLNQYVKELSHSTHDDGAAARATYAKIKKLAPPAGLVVLLERTISHVVDQ